MICHEKIVRDFLQSPHNKHSFNAFFKFCYRYTLGYLHYLKKLGFQMPVDYRIDKDPLKDLAIDILGKILQAKKGKPCYLVFDYFTGLGINDFKKQDAGYLYEKFTIFLRRKLRQERSRVMKEKEPQIENLKKRFNDILKSANYCSIKSSKKNDDFICLAANKQNLRPEKPLLPYDRLLQIVEEMPLDSIGRTEWCKKIFERLDEETDFQNVIKKHELLSTVISVNARYVEIDSIYPVGLPTPTNELLRKEIIKERKKTMTWITAEVVAPFVSQNRLTNNKSSYLITACDEYLLDFSNGIQVDSIPTYFREAMLLETHDRYLDDYKYVFETIITKAKEDFIRRLKNNPIIRNYGGY